MIILIIILNAINASLASLRLLLTGEKSGKQNCVLPILEHRPWGQEGQFQKMFWIWTYPTFQNYSGTEKGGLNSGGFNSQI